jgi:polyketide biosynthesis enoyl-CoA hydratase PksH
MDIVSDKHRTIRVRQSEDICTIQLHRPDTGNAISDLMIQEVAAALRECEATSKIVVLEGLPDVFCSGADFDELRARFETGNGAIAHGQNPGPLYDLWHHLATGPFVSVAHVRGRVNAGGIGFVAACDIVLSEEKAAFSLSELLFGLMPACVMPFLVRRVGFAKANCLTLTTQPIQARQALEWGLVDAVEESSENLLRKQLLRLRRLGKDGIARYKRYASELDPGLADARPKALAANLEVFSDPDNLAKIARYVNTGKFPWETG